MSLSDEQEITASGVDMSQYNTSSQPAFHEMNKNFIDELWRCCSGSIYDLTKVEVSKINTETFRYFAT
jgi:hypothetical protein